MNSSSHSPPLAESREGLPHPFKLYDIVYHRSVYEHKEPLKIVGVLEDKLLLEGDFSGGTNPSKQRDWLSIKGASRVFNHAFKVKCQREALNALDSAINLEIAAADPEESLKACKNAISILAHLANRILELTSDVSLNTEF